jgi:hypothetical protein
MPFVAILLSVFTLQGVPFKATLTPAGHHPKVNTRWAYSVTVRNNTGKPIAAKITVQIKDPIGGVHPVEFFNVKKNVVNHPIKGVFRDAVTWPPESRGVPLTFRVIVKALGKKRTLSYLVTSK